MAAVSVVIRRSTAILFIPTGSAVGHTIFSEEKAPGSASGVY